MFKKLAMSVTAATVLLTAAPALAMDANPAVKARQSHMQLYAYNLGILGGMAKGTVDYDAAAAQTAADNLAGLATMNTMSFWQPGTAMGEVEGSNALPALWSADSTAGKIAMDFAAAAQALQAAAGTDLASLQGAMGGVGAGCGGCHKAYRHSDK